MHLAQCGHGEFIELEKMLAELPYSRMWSAYIEAPW